MTSAELCVSRRAQELVWNRRGMSAAALRMRMKSSGKDGAIEYLREQCVRQRVILPQQQASFTGSFAEGCSVDVADEFMGTVKPPPSITKAWGNYFKEKNEGSTSVDNAKTAQNFLPRTSGSMNGARHEMTPLAGSVRLAQHDAARSALYAEIYRLKYGNSAIENHNFMQALLAANASGPWIGHQVPKGLSAPCNQNADMAKMMVQQNVKSPLPFAFGYGANQEKTTAQPPHQSTIQTPSPQQRRSQSPRQSSQQTRMQRLPRNQMMQPRKAVPLMGQVNQIQRQQTKEHMKEVEQVQRQMTLEEEREPAYPTIFPPTSLLTGPGVLSPPVSPPVSPPMPPQNYHPGHGSISPVPPRGRGLASISLPVTAPSRVVGSTSVPPPPRRSRPAVGSASVPCPSRQFASASASSLPSASATTSSPPSRSCSIQATLRGGSHRIATSQTNNFSAMAGPAAHGQDEQDERRNLLAQATRRLYAGVSPPPYHLSLGSVQRSVSRSLSGQDGALELVRLASFEAAHPSRGAHPGVASKPPPPKPLTPPSSLQLKQGGELSSLTTRVRPISPLQAQRRAAAVYSMPNNMGSAGWSQSCPCLDTRVNVLSSSVPDSGRLVAMQQAVHGISMSATVPLSPYPTAEPQRGRTLSPGLVAPPASASQQEHTWVHGAPALSAAAAADGAAAATVAAVARGGPAIADVREGSNMVRGLSHVI